MLDRAGIGRLIPHSGPMILLDQVVSYDEDQIDCRTRTHLRADNPLRRHGQIAAVCGAEYGAQAAAVHGPLVEGHGVQPGQVVLLRGIVWTAPFLSDIEDDLQVHAACLRRDDRGLAYRFNICAGGREVVTGEIGVILS